MEKLQQFLIQLLMYTQIALWIYKLTSIFVETLLLFHLVSLFLSINQRFFCTSQCYFSSFCISQCYFSSFCTSQSFFSFSATSPSAPLSASSLPNAHPNSTSLPLGDSPSDYSAYIDESDSLSSDSSGSEKNQNKKISPELLKHRSVQKKKRVLVFQVCWIEN